MSPELTFVSRFSPVFRSSFRWLGCLGAASLLWMGCPSSQPPQKQPSTEPQSRLPSPTQASPRPEPLAPRKVKIISFEAVPNPTQPTMVGKPTTLPGIVSPHVAPSLPPHPATPPVDRTKIAGIAPRQPQPRQSLFTPIPKTKPIDPATMFHPIPFSLPIEQAEKRHTQRLVEAKSLAVGVMEKQFFQQLLAERRREGQLRTYQDQMVRLAGQRYVRLRGLSAYQMLGYRELQRMESVLAQYLAQQGPPLSIPKTPAPVVALAQQLIDCAGYYPLLFKQIGIQTNGTSLSREQRYWLRTLFLARWGLQAWGIYPLPIMMGQETYQDYLKARILWTPHFRKRLFAVKEARRLDPAFPVFRVLGWLFLQAGRVDAAKKSLQDAIQRDPKDTFSRTLLDKISRPPT